ncbi:hypothetical protein FHS95_001022 [Sphingomonas naasensis]|uniref:Uncharacterized protein n=1 Tax=Sphingomonas naasensis TaxID=1344951 RepID=A0A4V3QXH7_9SPHN|nr:hypothetical protein [Sphingomonas naasensis]NIJ19353.1 hypothetical protein [Sphingomonas naasensis]TGX46522.1 hypothetical protein E5A74_05100 [Sphingomonas naasensis]
MIDDPVQAFESADARKVVDALWSSWPIVVTLGPAEVGMDESPDRLIDFIKTVQELCDAGLVTFEAFVVGPGGPQAIDAALTARGRALLGSRAPAPPATITQLAS